MDWDATMAILEALEREETTVEAAAARASQTPVILLAGHWEADRRCVP